MSSPTLESLPDDLLLNCLAYVSRLYYPTLSLVSKRFQSLLASQKLYKTRSLLSHTESCLYVCIRHRYDDYRWFTLYKKPNQALTCDTSQKERNKSSGYVLARVSTLPSPYPKEWSLVAVGSNIYIIGADRSSRVSILDCKSHTWHEGPKLRTKLTYFSATVLDEKIYVVGCYEEDGYKDPLFDVLDTKTKIWDPIPIKTEEDMFDFSEITCFDGKLYLMVNYSKSLVYIPEEGRWDMVHHNDHRWEPNECNMWRCIRLASASYCVIENVNVLYTKQGFKWYDTEVGLWRNLEGLVRFPEIPPHTHVILANHGGKIAVLWDKIWRCIEVIRKRVWCAVIAVKRLGPCEIWGEVEWFDHVLTIPAECMLEKALAPTV